MLREISFMSGFASNSHLC